MGVCCQMELTLVWLSLSLVSTVALSRTTGNQGCDKCGMEQSPTLSGLRIPGGHRTRVSQYPWMAMVSIVYPRRGRSVCGGSLISSKFVLTAAHCVDPNEMSKTKVVLGDYDLDKKNETKLEKTFNLRKVIVHEQFGHEGVMHDIALVELDEEVDLSVYTPVCLPRRGQSFDNKPAVAIGWGATKYGGRPNPVLLGAKLTVRPNSKPGYVRTDNGKENRGVCKGDSGGPLTHVSGKGQHALIGVASHIGPNSQGKFCEVGSTNFYTKVSDYRDWIDQNSKDTKYCKSGPESGSKFSSTTTPRPLTNFPTTTTRPGTKFPTTTPRPGTKFPTTTKQRLTKFPTTTPRYTTKFP